MNKLKHYPVYAAGWAYFVGALLLLSVGSLVQEMDFKAGMLITEYGLVLLPVLLIGAFLKIDMKSALRLKPLRLSEFFLIPFTVIMALPITLFLNMLVIVVMAYFGKAYGMPIPSADNLADLSMLFFIISISAGICEEFFFRGMMLDAYTARFDAKKGIVISAVLFGMFHFNPQNLLGPIFLGLLFGYIVLTTGSLWAGILAHMTNNGVAVLMMYVANVAQKGAFTNGSSADAFNSNPGQMAVALLFLGTIAIGSAFIVFLLLSVIRAGRKAPEGVPQLEPVDKDEISADEETFGSTPKMLRLAESIPLILPAVMYTAISYYLIAIKQ